MATTALRSSSSNTSAGTAEAQSPAPSGASAGDLELIFVSANNSLFSMDDNNGATPFTHATIDGDLTWNPAGNAQSACFFWRRLTGAEPDPRLFTLSASNRWSTVGLCFSDPDPTTEFDVSIDGGNASTGSTTIAAIGITTATNNAIHVCGVFIDGGSGAVTSTPSGYTAEQLIITNQALLVAYKVITSAGATGDQTFAWTNSLGNGGFSLAVKNQDTSSGGGHGLLIGGIRNSLMALA